MDLSGRLWGTGKATEIDPTMTPQSLPPVRYRLTKKLPRDEVMHALGIADIGRASVMHLSPFRIALQMHPSWKVPQ